MYKRQTDWSDEEQIADYVHKLLDKETFDKRGLVYGMGHPVYSVSDPRTLVLRGFAKQLAEEKGFAEVFELHERVERIAPLIISAKRRIYKGVSANVDFYSGFVYRMLDIPPELYTPLFAISRIVGWTAHRLEELTSGSKLIRPAYKSVAEPHRYVPLADRVPLEIPDDGTCFIPPAQTHSDTGD